MMKKRLISVALSAILLISMCVMPTTAQAVTSATPAQDKYVDLSGDWHFKLYRTYGQMFQWLNFDPSRVPITWEDLSAATVPNASTFKTWEVMSMPSTDYASPGGLLNTTREDGSNLLPAWSEAWVSKEFTLPDNLADFTTEQTVTLLFGTVDDNDVIYINGQPVASSGFLDASKQPVVNNLPTGGFDYVNRTMLFEKSYWDQAREYEIPTSALKPGVNEISVRLYNNNSNGGFYSGQSYALAGNDMAVRNLKNMPLTPATDTTGAQAAVDAQKAALQSKDSAAFAATVSESYNNNGVTKAEYVATAMADANAQNNLVITDTGATFWMKDSNTLSYEATREVSYTDADGKAMTSSSTFVQYFSVDATGAIKEQGNMDRCYTTEYASDLFSTNLNYSVYLPPSYYTDTAKSYPVVYLLHGMNSSSGSFINVDKIDEFMDAQIASGNIQEMIVIMPDSGKTAGYRDTPIGSDMQASGPWESQLVKELKPLVESRYRMMTGPQYTGISGISMGGGGAMTIGLKYPELFTSIASHMGALSTTTLDQLKAVSAETLAFYDFYMDVGNQDDRVNPDNTTMHHEYLTSIGKAHVYSRTDGGHNSAFYMSGMDESMKMHSDHFANNVPSTAYTVNPIAKLDTTTAIVPAGTVLIANSNLPQSTLNKMINAAKASNYPGEMVLTADFSLQNADGSKAQPDANTMIRIDIPGINSTHEALIMHEKADGTIEYIVAKVYDGYITFVPPSFSVYSVLVNWAPQVIVPATTTTTTATTMLSPQTGVNS